MDGRSSWTYDQPDWTIHFIYPSIHPSHLSTIAIDQRESDYPPPHLSPHLFLFSLIPPFYHVSCLKSRMSSIPQHTSLRQPPQRKSDTRVHSQQSSTWFSTTTTGTIDQATDQPTNQTTNPPQTTANQAIKQCNHSIHPSLINHAITPHNPSTNSTRSPSSKRSNHRVRRSTRPSTPAACASDSASTCACAV
jgi:hypothetical protein